jgi:mono/diheme cytochrome c family protein
MKPIVWVPGMLAFTICAGCTIRHATSPAPHPTATGSAIVESSGGKQLGSPGTTLPQPLIVQVNDKQGNAVTGALVSFTGPGTVRFDPAQVLTDSSGQASTQVTLGGMAGRYDLTASSTDSAGKGIVLKVSELSAGYQQQLGYELEEKYCARCHDSESTPQRVSNFDNLAVKPHPFTDGDALNKLSDSDLNAVISHGGPSLNGSALMPPYASTLGKAEIQALIAYIRLVAEPPYKAAGVVYARQ